VQLFWLQERLAFLALGVVLFFIALLQSSPFAPKSDRLSAA
jgi:hypothetical protein